MHTHHLKFPLAADAHQIWRAGVAAVASDRLVREAVNVADGKLHVAGDEVPLKDIDRVIVLGGGKAGAGMAAGLVGALQELLPDHPVVGWVNVPADCVGDANFQSSLAGVQLHAARPAGVNEPTAAGVEGVNAILALAAGMTPRDVCFILISGGGSALLPAPCAGITLDDKLAVTKHLMRAGAPIEALNTIRKHLSRIKGGRLWSTLGANTPAALFPQQQTRVWTLVLSDIIDDPLDLIASGPTVPDASTAAMALQLLQQYAPDESAVPAAIWTALRQGAATAPPTGRVPLRNLVIGNNQTALTAAGTQARAMGYTVIELGANLRGEAKDVGADLWQRCHALRLQGATGICLLSGGEPIVHFDQPAAAGKGGRNQEVALGALAASLADGPNSLAHLAILSGGTDGEDGPTDAAGAWLDSAVAAAAQAAQLDVDDYLRRHDSYQFFKQAGGLLITGPTHTNVMDVRVALVGDRD